MPTQSDVLTRLRNETAPLHRSVELAMDLPDAVQSRADYAALLGRLLAFHSAADAQLAYPAWHDDWTAVGITLAQHSRVGLLRSDLARLDAPVAAQPPTLAPPASFGAALGWLYVLEGSSLGGRVLGPAIRARVADIPTGFFDSDGREHPHPWRSLQAAILQFDGAGGEFGDLLEGATAMFRSFSAFLTRASWAEAA